MPSLRACWRTALSPPPASMSLAVTCVIGSSS